MRSRRFDHDSAGDLSPIKKLPKDSTSTPTKARPRKKSTCLDESALFIRNMSMTDEFDTSIAECDANTSGNSTEDLHQQGSVSVNFDSSAATRLLHSSRIAAYPWLEEKVLTSNIESDLKGKSWLSDVTIEQSIAAIQQTCTLKNILVFDCFLYQGTDKDAYEHVAGFCCNNEALNQDYFLVIVNEKSHWSIVFADLNSKRLIFINSLSQHCNVCEVGSIFANILKIVRVALAIAKVPFLQSQWTFCNCVDVAQQENSYDCGVHVIINAYAILNELPLPESCPSMECRYWISMLVMNKQTKVQRKAKSADRIFDAKQMGARIWNGGIEEICIEEKAFCKVMPYSRDIEKSSWSHCKIATCSGEKAETKQIFCTICWSWYYIDCLPGAVNFDGSYFKCMTQGDQLH